MTKTPKDETQKQPVWDEVLREESQSHLHSYCVDLSTVFRTSEALQIKGGTAGLQELASGMRALHAATLPAVELALAVLMESAGGKPLPQDSPARTEEVGSKAEKMETAIA